MGRKRRRKTKGSYEYGTFVIERDIPIPLPCDESR